MLELVSWNSMIDGYVRNGDVALARELFDDMPDRDVFSCNSMISGMIEAGTIKATLVSILTACANFRRLDLRKWIHSRIKDNGIEPDKLLSATFLTMYAKCGVIDIARHIFDEMPQKSVVS
ncbi:hypothetical protein GH714_014090 [Hevea brasiliensis]|uniref:Pentatricopeptide repeat-containing protein n=1 Tax=Hevea brasiliensis TaxID=3981 RepID=A0A6A6M507_HEVBR|nr:hypothetical protein GH714_014090 [Hevea brasiliensis]